MPLFTDDSYASGRGGAAVAGQRGRTGGSDKWKVHAITEP